jgi:hypothetical protein
MKRAFKIAAVTSFLLPGALVVLAVGAFLIGELFESARVERFYAERPMLRAMRDAQSSASYSKFNDPWPHLSAILLDRVPIGSARPDATRTLATEGLSCQPHNQGGRKLLVCGAENRPASVTRWYVELSLDDTDRVAGGRVLALKAAT